MPGLAGCGWRCCGRSRFSSAEALAYLGSTAGVETLVELTQKHTLFAQHACMAMANLSETICRDKLAQLLASTEPTVRSSAFHALTLIDETDIRLGGQYINDTFWLHRVPQAPSPMVYFATSKRPQVLLFGRKKPIPEAG